jgi:hypothetical protein
VERAVPAPPSCPVSLWKRPSDFPVENRAGWNRRLPTKANVELRAQWDVIAHELRAEGVLLHRLPFAPWSADAHRDSKLRVALGDGTQPLTRMAPLVQALASAWDEELQVHAYAARPDLVDPSHVIERLEPALKPEGET